jgi:hypothetical protein
MRVDGADEWAVAAEALLERVRLETGGAVDDGLALIQQEAQRNLTFYTHPPGTPTPSAPGEPPALISGALRRAVKIRRLLFGPLVFSGAVGSTSVYGPIQERGGWAGRAHRSYLPPRPWLRPAALSAAPKIRKLFVDAWTRAIRG